MHAHFVYPFLFGESGNNKFIKNKWIKHVFPCLHNKTSAKFSSRWKHDSDIHWSAREFSQTFVSVLTRLWGHGEKVLFNWWKENMLRSSRKLFDVRLTTTHVRTQNIKIPFVFYAEWYKMGLLVKTRLKSDGIIGTVRGRIPFFCFKYRRIFCDIIFLRLTRTVIHLPSKTKCFEYWKNNLTLSSPAILSPISQIMRIWRCFEN